MRLHILGEECIYILPTLSTPSSSFTGVVTGSVLSCRIVLVLPSACSFLHAGFYRVLALALSNRLISHTPLRNNSFPTPWEAVRVTLIVADK